ncbi:nitronate monooxygenase [bacterium]|nr:nitronate monooxygenase [bacterium]
MSINQLPKLSIGPFTAPLPIIQGGMGVGISLSGLASAVAKAGGIGVISSVGVGMNEPDYKKNFTEANCRALTREFQKVREQTDGILGCNIMVALSDYEEQVDAAMDAEVDILFLGAGLPLKFSKNVTPDRLTHGHTRIAPIVSSGRALEVIFKTWDRKYKTIPDAVVVEGPMAGGHLGFKNEQLDDPAFALQQLVPEVVNAAIPFEQKYGRSIPVIAAGGIYTGRNIRQMLDLGASGVQLGTRFVATHECDADPRFKEAYIKATKKDVCIIQSPVGLPGRALKNTFLDSVAAGGKHPFSCPWKCLRTCDYKVAPYCIANALVQAKRGNIDHGFVFAGANAWRVDKIVSVQELLDELIHDFTARG